MSETLNATEAARPYSERLARYVGAFLDELERGGVREVVVSPGSRSTPLALMAFASNLDVYVDVDERGAAFFALGLAKATGRAVAVICTSGTAAANYYPAVLEAEISRVPLLVLSGDRPARLQQLGAPQTCDQVKLFGDHVRRFWNMPEPDGSTAQLRYARQVAREALAALEPHALTSAPVHLNFPFDEPLTPAHTLPDAFCGERAQLHQDVPPVVEARGSLDEVSAEHIGKLLLEKRAIALCGEGTLGPFDAQDPHCWDERERCAEQLCAWAHRFDIPLLADPLSQLRNFTDEAIVDNYDNIFGRDDRPDFDIVIRFGRYPISKRVFKLLGEREHIQIVVDPLESRDFNSATTTLVKTAPLVFVESLSSWLEGSASLSEAGKKNDPIAQWAEANERERVLIASVEEASYVQVCTTQGCHVEEVAYEGAYVQELIDLMPPRSLLFSANSMAIRALDTFCVKPAVQNEKTIQLGKRIEAPDGSAEPAQGPSRQITMLANRGLNGIDGTLSSALGAAQAYDQAFFLTGDLTLLYDLNALALEHEFELRSAGGEKRPSVVIVLFNNSGGGIFERLPQRSADPYFERLFLTPQNVDFEKAAEAFGVLYAQASSHEAFRDTLASWVGDPGIHLLEVKFSLEGLDERYRVFQ